MNNILTNPRSAAIASVLLALPFMSLFTLLVLHIEPPLGPFRPLVTAPVDQPNVVGTAIALGTLLLSVVAFALNLAPIVRNVRAGSGLAASPVNLVLAAIILLYILLFVGAIVVDQYPCWIGVPNCD